MADENGTWWFRQNGVVTVASHGVADPAPMHRDNAYIKAAGGLELTEAERAAVEAVKDNPAIPGPMVADADTLLGFMFLIHPELVEAVDALAQKWGDALRMPGFVTWPALRRYVERAEAAEYDAAGMGGEESELAHLESMGLAPDRISEILQDRATQAEAMAAWEASPEGQRAALAMAPDGGPEGWSRVPPQNPDHPSSPGGVEAQEAAFKARMAEAAEARGEPPPTYADGYRITINTVPAGHPGLGGKKPGK